MKRSLTILLFFTIFVSPPSLALAQAEGCWVEYDNPSKCSSAVINCSFDLETDIHFYGAQVAGMCDAIRQITAGHVTELLAERNKADTAQSKVRKLRQRVRTLRKRIKRLKG